jgi:D-alanyl-D-alanine carboxypeptidase
MHKFIPLVLFFSLFFNQAGYTKQNHTDPITADNLTAKSWLVSDGEGNIIASENIDAVRSIASVTKLVTVITVLDSRAPLDKPLDLTLLNLSKKNKKAKRTPYDNLTRRELINLAMIRSDNRAARLLCQTYFMGYEQCIKDMNRKVRSLGMLNSVFYDPTGLDDRNNSTARDLIKLAQTAVNYPEVVAASHQSHLRIKIKKHWFIGNNTNPLIGSRHDIQISKTGWTTRAGGCIVMLLDTDKGRRIVVVLGSKNTHTRIPEADFISGIDEEEAMQPDPPKEQTSFWSRIF